MLSLYNQFLKQLASVAEKHTSHTTFDHALKRSKHRSPRLQRLRFQVSTLFSSHSSYLVKMSDALVPPNPNELLSAALTVLFCARPGWT